MQSLERAELGRDWNYVIVTLFSWIHRGKPRVLDHRQNKKPVPPSLRIQIWDIFIAAGFINRTTINRFRMGVE
jgi:hypothetical protein